MYRKLIFYLILVSGVSFIANWGVQLTYYYFNIVRNPLAFDGSKVLFDYKTGIIGDTLLLPIMNPLMFYCIFSLKLTLKKLPIIKIAVLSLVGDFLLHILQGLLGLTNWSMTEPFHWNFVSYWHMFTFFFQLALILTFIYSIYKYKGEVKKNKMISSAVFMVTIISIIFLILFIHDYGSLLFERFYLGIT